MTDHQGHDHDHATGLRSALQRIFRPHSHDAADSLDTALESSARGIRAVRVSFLVLLVTSVLQLTIVIVTAR